MQDIAKVAGFTSATALQNLSQGVVIQLLAENPDLAAAWAAAPDANWAALFEANKIAEDYYYTLRMAAGIPGTTDTLFNASKKIRDLNYDGWHRENFSTLDEYTQTILFNFFRESVRDFVRKDDRAKGYILFNEVGACTYCRSMRMETIYYTSRSNTAPFTHWKGLHDNCNCTLQPVFDGQTTADVATAAELDAVKKIEKIVSEKKLNGSDAIMFFLKNQGT